jgi:hypothetical protein
MNESVVVVVVVVVVVAYCQNNQHDIQCIDAAAVVVP